MKNVRVALIMMLILTLLVGCSTPSNEVTSEDDSTKVLEAYLQEPIHIIVPYAAGGGADIANRIIAKYLSEELGTDVVVDNKPGAGGVVAATEYLTEQANTNNLIYINSSILSYVTKAQETAFTRADFDPFFSFQVIKFGLYAAPGNTGIGSIEDLEAFAKENKVIFGSPGKDTPLYGTQANIYSSMGGDNDTVTYENGNQGIVNLLANDTAIMATSINVADQFVKEGSIVPLAILSDEDYDGPYGQYSSIYNYGYEMSNDMLTMFAIRSGTDQVIKDRLYEALMNVTSNEAFKEEMSKAQNATYKIMDANGISEFLDNMDKVTEALLGQ